MVVQPMEVLGLIGIILKKKEELSVYVAVLGSITLGIAALRTATTSTSTTAVSVFVPGFLCRVLLSPLIFFPLSPQIKSPSGDPIFGNFGVLSFVKLGGGVWQAGLRPHHNTEIIIPQTFQHGSPNHPVSSSPHHPVTPSLHCPSQLTTSDRL
jgi:hypothetical protein